MLEGSRKAPSPTAQHPAQTPKATHASALGVEAYFALATESSPWRSARRSMALAAFFEVDVRPSHRPRVPVLNPREALSPIDEAGLFFF